MAVRLFGRKSRPRVYVTRTLPGDALDRLREQAEVEVWPQEPPPSRDELARALTTAEGLLCLLTDNIDAGLIDGAPRLRALSTMSVGYDHIDVEACTRRRIAVGYTPGVLTEATADLAFALLLAAARRLPEGERAVREGRWSAWHPSFLLGRDVYGATLGIVGLGQIGTAVARRARGFEMRVLYTGHAPQPPKEAVLGVEFRSFEELLAQSDFVSVHVPLAPETRHMFNDAAFARMKPTGFFVNTARGAVVDEAALVRALKARKIAGAGLDVFEHEPKVAAELKKMKNVVLNPHLGSATVEVREEMANIVVDNIEALIAGRTPPNCVNPQVLAKS